MMKLAKVNLRTELQTLHEKVGLLEPIQKSIIQQVIDSLIINEIVVPMQQLNLEDIDAKLREQFERLEFLNSTHKEIIVMVLQGLLLQDYMLKQVNSGNIRFGQTKIISQ